MAEVLCSHSRAELTNSITYDHSLKECPICYENLDSVSIIFLQCFHYVCKKCLFKLDKKICPHCRFTISQSVFTNLVENNLKQSSPKISKNVSINTRRMNKIEIPDVIEMDNQIIRITRTKKRQKKDNKNKAKRGESNYRNSKRLIY
jgi:hypothetical protein